MSELAEKTCVPCRGGVPPLTADQIRPLQESGRDWEVVKNHHLERESISPTSRVHSGFVNKVGRHCRRTGHHPTSFSPGEKLALLSGRQD